MKKTFVLLTEATLSSEKSTLNFGGDNDIVIPLAVVERIYQYDKSPEKAKIASKFVDYISTFSMKDLISNKGVKQSNGSYLRILDCGVISSQVNELHNVSDLYKRSFQVCLDLVESSKDSQVILISQNPSVRLKAQKLGIKSQEFKDEIFPLPRDQYKGRVSVFSTKSSIDKLYQDLKAFKPENAEQKMLMECLLAPPEIAPLVIVKGGAGTGKTYCALAAALHNLASYGPISTYEQILVGAPTVTIDEDLGYLPGDIDDKVGPYINGVQNNLIEIFKNNAAAITNGKEKVSKKECKASVIELFDRQFIQIQAIGFLRGSSIANTFYFLDEVQNVKPEIMKDIITRLARGSKLILAGDPTQVNAPGLNERRNGLVYASEKFKDIARCWQIELDSQKTIRSELAKIAQEIL